MDRWLFAAAVALALAASGLSGCKDDVAELSRAETLLAEQHEVWHKARKSLESDNPDWNLLRNLEGYLIGETLPRVKSDYGKPNKDEVVAKLDEIYEVYREKVMTKLDTTSPRVALRQGVAPEDVRKAFMEVNPLYEELERMTAGK